jgi:hypothetical protein
MQNFDVLPELATIMNLLPAAAAFGVIVALFQVGWDPSPSGSPRPDRWNRSCPSS